MEPEAAVLASLRRAVKASSMSGVSAMSLPPTFWLWACRQALSRVTAR